MAREIPRERFELEAEWPAPAAEPDREPADPHRGPLDDERDAGWLEPDDPRRIAIERRRRR